MPYSSHFHRAPCQKSATVWLVSVLLLQQQGKNSVCACLTEVQDTKKQISLFGFRLGKKHQLRLKKSSR